MPIKPLPIIGPFNKERFTQFNPEDTANWYIQQSKSSKRGQAMYPAMGRKHVNVVNRNVLQFDIESRDVHETVKYAYVFNSDKVIRYDRSFNEVDITPSGYNTTGGSVYFDYLSTPGFTLVAFSDGINIYVHCEETINTVTVTDSNAPQSPRYLAAFGNRILCGNSASTQFNLSEINLGGVDFAAGDVNIDPATCFSDADGNALFAQERGEIRGFAVLHNTLYIFTPFTTGVWSNTPSQVTNVVGTSPPVAVVTTFPFKKNTTYDFNYGLQDYNSLDVSFGVMTWLGQSKNGLIQVVASSGGQPKPISDAATDILFQRNSVTDMQSPFVSQEADGFMYQYEGTPFYRLSAGKFLNTGVVDAQTDANSIEYNFKTKTWHRCIEANGERNRIKKHIFFSNRHLVTVEDDGTVYEMAGNIYTNEVRNDDQSDGQASDAYTVEPMRYERVTPIVADGDDGELIHEWVQIDFVWGVKTFNNENVPFENAEFIVDEDGVTYLTDEDGNFLITENSNTPQLNEGHYYNWFKPSVELYVSDDGGVSFYSADKREFSQLGVYEWRMRWYELGTARNRVYKLVCVSPAPMVVLNGLTEVRRASGPAA